LVGDVPVGVGRIKRTFKQYDREKWEVLDRYKTVELLVLDDAFAPLSTLLGHIFSRRAVSFVRCCFPFVVFLFLPQEICMTF
jgi:hypothetical protein